MKQNIYFIGLVAACMVNTLSIRAQESSAQTLQNANLHEILLQKIEALDADLATLYDKYMGVSSVFIPLETYIQEGKDCANTGYANSAHNIVVGLGAGCSQVSSVIIDAMVTNNGECPSSWTKRGSGAFDGGYRRWRAGRIKTYAFCVKGNTPLDPNPVVVQSNYTPPTPTATPRHSPTHSGFVNTFIGDGH